MIRLWIQLRLIFGFFSAQDQDLVEGGAITRELHHSTAGATHRILSAWRLS